MEKYGLVWEKREEELERELKYKKILLEEREDLRIEGGMWSPGHVILEGDNLLGMSYLESVGDKADVILCDPPYNTFGNLTYNDGRKNKEDEYEFSEWLNFMDVRMRKAYDILSEEGVIYVTIDDRMMFHMKLLMDSIFGYKNFICNFIWRKRTVPTYMTTNNLSINHEYILMYGKDKNKVKFKEGKVTARTLARDYIHEDERGKYSLKSIRGGATRKSASGKNTYVVTSPNGYKFDGIWQVNEATFKEFEAIGRIHWGKDDGKSAPDRKTYIDDVKGLPMGTILDSRDVGFTATGTVELGGILGETGIFDFPKPSKLFKFLVGRLDFGRDIHVVDIFSGSGTTGHAILDLNKESKEVYRFTLMNVPEESGDIKNICEEVTYERVSRLMRGYENKGGKRMKKKMGKLSYYKVLLEDKE